MAIDFQRIQGVFQAAAVLPSVERAAVLERECGDDAELRRRVEALLQAHDDSGELPAAEAEPDRTYVPAVEPGQVFAGRYKLRQKLAEGGMGVVFVADQTAPVQRRVALKIIRAGLDTRRLLARFDQERQALALMDHPNIAKVFDAGMDEAQRPYFAMELVKGLPLTRYCDDARLPPRQRLELFIPVCQAVQHAHQKGIIHRDLKPSNILVGLYDGRPVPKVIDFGVAKATGPRLTEQSLYTEVGSIIGTLEYMSPEQAELNNLDIDTRSDIYALGVILYELLTGSVPFGRKELEQAGLAEMLRVIKETEPPRPSTKLSSSQELPAIAACRKLEPRKLTQLLQGELDWIVMKALEKDRARRFETANGLARDIERYLADQPVQAGPPSASYRLRKFVRRNRVVLSTAGLVLISLAAGTTMSIWQAIRATRAEHLAQARLETEARAREEAQQNLDKAREVVDDMYIQVAANWLRETPRMLALQREFLDKALRFYEQFAQRQSTDPSIRLETAKAYKRVADIHQYTPGGRPRAETAYRNALDRLEALVAEFPDVAEYRQQLAATMLELATAISDRTTDAEKLKGRALEIQEKLTRDFPHVPEYRFDLGNGYCDLGDFLAQRDRGREADAYLRLALAVHRKLVAESPTPNHRKVLADALRTFAQNAFHMGEIDDQQKASREAAPILEALVAEFPEARWYQRPLARNWYWIGRTLPLQESESFLQRAAALLRKLSGTGLPEEALPRTLRLLGDRLWRLGRVEEAEKCLREAVAVEEKRASFSPGDLPGAYTLDGSYCHLADFLADTGKRTGAEAAYRRAIELRERLGAAMWFDLNNNYAGLARLLASAGRLEAERDACRKALEGSPANALAHARLAAMLWVLGQREEAVKELGRAADLERSNANWRITYADRLIQLGRSAEAVQALQKAIELNPKESGAYRFLSSALWNLGRRDEAVQALRKQVELDGKNADAHSRLGQWLNDLGRKDEAVKELRKAVELNPLLDGWSRKQANWNTLGAACYRAGAWKEAIDALTKSMELRKGGDSAEWFFLAMAHWRLGEKAKARDWYAKAVEWMDKNNPKDDELLRFRAEAAAVLGVPETPATNAKQVPGVKD